jgi:hypothetical protein
MVRGNAIQYFHLVYHQAPLHDHHHTTPFGWYFFSHWIQRFEWRRQEALALL